MKFAAPASSAVRSDRATQPSSFAANVPTIALACALCVASTYGTASASAPSMQPGYAAGSQQTASRLAGGQSLSAAVIEFAKGQGWEVDWQPSEDYFLDADLELGGRSTAEALTWAVRYYQAGGALLSVAVVDQPAARRITVTRGRTDGQASELSLHLRNPIAVPVATRTRVAPTQPVSATGGQLSKPAVAAPARPASAPGDASLALAAGVPASPRHEVQRWVPLTPAAPHPGTAVATAPTQAIAAAAPPKALTLAKAALGAGALQLDTPSSLRTVTVERNPKGATPSAIAPAPAAPLRLSPVTKVRFSWPQPRLAVSAWEPQIQSSDLRLAWAEDPKADIEVVSAELAPGADVAALATADPIQTLLPVVVKGSRDEVWTAPNGSTLKTTIKDWAARKNWELVWNDKRADLQIVGNVQVEGTLVDAVTYLFEAYRRGGATFAVDIYTKQNLILVKDH